VDATGLVRTLFDAVPAHRTFGLTVRRAVDGAAEVAVSTVPALTNVIGSLHSSGLITLIDAAGLGAIVSAAARPAQVDGIVPLGAAALLAFRAPARGVLVARCDLTDDQRRVLGTVFTADADRVRMTTSAEVTDEGGTVVCRGTFEWSVRRARP
jgi:acyl-coenzyme A thioesterase PaaI-like protein